MWVIMYRTILTRSSHGNHKESVNEMMWFPFSYRDYYTSKIAMNVEILIIRNIKI